MSSIYFCLTLYEIELVYTHVIDGQVSFTSLRDNLSRQVLSLAIPPS
jgi:hypothetical protein